MDTLEWKTDRAGDALWRGTQFLGCIYNRDGICSRFPPHGWRALAGEDMVPVGDVVATREQPDARMGARALLEAYVGAFLPLPTALELLDMTNP